MKSRGLSESRHARAPSRDKRGTKSQKPPAVRAKKVVYDDQTTCDSCGSVYTRKTWRQPSTRGATTTARTGAVVPRCPACEQMRDGRSYGSVLLRGSYVLAHEEEIRRRARHVAARAGYTQPQRRIVAFRRTRTGFEVTTTSQKLAHRLVHELKKAFHGRASYSWSDRDGRLMARWERVSDADTT